MTVPFTSAGIRAEPPLPVTVAQNNHRIGARGIVIRVERASAEHRHAEHVEVVGADAPAGREIGGPIAGTTGPLNIDAAGVVLLGGNVFEELILGPQPLVERI